MTKQTLTKAEYRAYMVGVFGLFGMVFGPAQCYYSLEFWATAPTWNFIDSIRSSLTFCVVFALASNRQRGFSFLRFIGFLILANLVSYQMSYTLDANNSFVLLPSILSLFGCWICGQFTLSLFRSVSSSYMKSTTRDLIFSGGALTAMTIAVLVCYNFLGPIKFTIEDGPVFVRVSAPVGYSQEQLAKNIVMLKDSILSDGEVKSIKTFIGHADSEDAFVQSLYTGEILLELDQARQWRKGSRRHAFINNLKRIESIVPNSMVRVLEKAGRPPFILQQASYIKPEIEFILNRDSLNRLGFKKEELVKTLAVRLRLLPKGASIEDFSVRNALGERVPFSVLGTFERRSIEYQADELPQGQWVLKGSGTDLLKPQTGFTIFLNEYKLISFNLALEECESQILRGLNNMTTKLDEKSISGIVLGVYSANSVPIRLGDVAQVEFGEIDRPQGEVQGQQYAIRLLSD